MQTLTKKTVQKLISQSGHVLDVADFDDVQELDRLAGRVAGVGGVERQLLRHPVDLDGVKFYPLTVAKSLWHDEMLESLELDGQYADLFLVWLLTLPLNADVLDEYTDRKQILKTVKSFARKLHCTTEDLTGVIKHCMPKASGGGEGDADYGGVVALLLKEYGGTPDQWLYDTPVEMISSLIEQFVEARAAEEQAANDGKAPMPTAKLRALREFREAVNALREKWNG